MPSSAGVHLSSPHINQPVVLIYYKQGTGTNISLLKSQPRREWELIFKKMALGEDEGEQGRRKMAALLELLAARAGPPLLKKKKRLLSQMYFVIIVFERKKFCLFIHK